MKGHKMDYTLNELDKILTAIAENLVLPDYNLDDAVFELDNMIERIRLFKESIQE